MTNQRQIEKVAQIIYSSEIYSMVDCRDIAEEIAEAGLLADPQLLDDLRSAFHDARTALKDRAEKAEAALASIYADHPDYTSHGVHD